MGQDVVPVILFDVIQISKCRFKCSQALAGIQEPTSRIGNVHYIHAKMNANKKYDNHHLD